MATRYLWNPSPATVKLGSPRGAASGYSPRRWQAGLPRRPPGRRGISALRGARAGTWSASRVGTMSPLPVRRRSGASFLACSSLCLLLSACIVSTDDDDGDGASADDSAEPDDQADVGDVADDDLGDCTSAEYGDGTCQVTSTATRPTSTASSSSKTRPRSRPGSSSSRSCWRPSSSATRAPWWRTAIRASSACASCSIRAGPRTRPSTRSPTWRRAARRWSSSRTRPPNAFVIPDLESGNAGFAVMVHTGLLDLDAPDEEMLGLVMHELEHAVGLHIVGDVKERLRTFYVADGRAVRLRGPRRTRPRASTASPGASWQARWAVPGPGAGRPAARGRPAVPDLQHGGAGARRGPGLHRRRSPTSRRSIGHPAAFSPIDADLVLDDPSIQVRVDDVAARAARRVPVRLPASFIEVLAELGGVTPEEVRAQFTPEDLGPGRGPALHRRRDELTLDRRERMRASRSRSRPRPRCPGPRCATSPSRRRPTTPPCRCSTPAA